MRVASFLPPFGATKISVLALVTFSTVGEVRSKEWISMAECRGSFGVGRSKQLIDGKNVINDNQEEANEQALTNCIAKNPVANTGCCHLVASALDACMTLAIDPKTGEADAQIGSSKEHARENTLDDCGKCNILNTVCPSGDKTLDPDIDKGGY